MLVSPCVCRWSPDGSVGPTCLCPVSGRGGAVRRSHTASAAAPPRPLFCVPDFPGLPWESVTANHKCGTCSREGKGEPSAEKVVSSFWNEAAFVSLFDLQTVNSLISEVQEKLWGKTLLSDCSLYCLEPAKAVESGTLGHLSSGGGTWK